MAQPLSQLGRQLSAMWKQLGAGQRVSVVFSAIAVIGGLIALSMWSSRSDYALLYGKLDDAEAARVVAALDDAKVPYRAAGGGSVYVPADKVHLMRMQLAAKGIPKGDGVGFEIFDKPNFGISDFVQRANYLRALQGELARTISQLDEVEAARVMIVMPENRLLTDNQQKTTASVFVRLRGNSELSASAVNSIRFLVANSVEGLKPDAVTVVDNRGTVLSGSEEEGSVAGLTAGQMASRRAIEQYLGQKAQGMLEKVLGPGQAVVRVAVDVNTETVNRTEEKFDPDGQVARSTTTSEEDNNSTTANSNGGVVGVAPNASAQSNAAPVMATATTTKHKTVNNQYEVSKTVNTILESPGGLKRVSAAVFVAAKFEGTGPDRKTVARTPEEMDKLRKIVQSALGLQPNDATRKDEITLEEIPFNDAFPVDVAQQMQKQQTHEMWWEIGRNAGYVLLALGIVVIFLKMLKKASAESEALVPRAGTGGNGQARTEEGVVTVEVLNRLIRENPANMNQAVRTWLSRGSATAPRN
ncbi:MAG TPA: flagellar basal-body MS-ring/collar protein FliF [Verrucomicrobiae bacterium]|nr:flagellar basal-body MS-ring/collar protein FliF [Verrucomicrobiae bacterium]